MANIAVEDGSWSDLCRKMESNHGYDFRVVRIASAADEYHNFECRLQELNCAAMSSQG